MNLVLAIYDWHKYSRRLRRTSVLTLSEAIIRQILRENCSNTPARCFVFLLLFAVFICMRVFFSLLPRFLVNKDLYYNAALVDRNKPGDRCSRRVHQTEVISRTLSQCSSDSFSSPFLRCFSACCLCLISMS